MTARVSLAGATFTYPGSHRAALSGVSLEVGAGEIVAVAGAAGAGTSTLLLVATGLAPRLVGGTLTGGRTVHARRCAIVFARPWTQLTGLCWTVRDEVAFGPASYGLPREAVLGAAERAMERLDDPAAELDPDAADALYGMLPELARAGMAILVATPDLERAARVATRAVAFERGGVVRDGAPAQVLA